MQELTCPQCESEFLFINGDEPDLNTATGQMFVTIECGECGCETRHEAQIRRAF